MGQILLLKIGYAHRSWVLPGGSVDFGETPEVTSTRELQEETGILLGDLTFTFVKPHTDYKGAHVHYYYGEVTDETIVIDDQEIVDGGWFHLDNLPTPHRSKLDKEIEFLKVWLASNK